GRRASGPPLLRAQLEPEERHQRRLADRCGDRVGGLARQQERRDRESHAAGEEEGVPPEPGAAARALHGQVVRTLRYLSNSSRMRPVPRTTQVSGSSSTWIGSPVSCWSSTSSPRMSAPPPV